LRLHRAAFQGLGSALRPTKRFGQRYNPKKTSASSATSAFQGFDPVFGCGSVALCIAADQVEDHIDLLSQDLLKPRLSIIDDRVGSEGLGITHHLTGIGRSARLKLCSGFM